MGELTFQNHQLIHPVKQVEGLGFRVYGQTEGLRFTVYGWTQGSRFTAGNGGGGGIVGNLGLAFGACRESQGQILASAFR